MKSTGRVVDGAVTTQLALTVTKTTNVEVFSFGHAPRDTQTSSPTHGETVVSSSTSENEKKVHRESSKFHPQNRQALNSRVNAGLMKVN